MKMWVDDVRQPPKEYDWFARSVNDAIHHIRWWEDHCKLYDGDGLLLDLDHDAGDFAYDGGDYIKILDWLEETGRNYPIRIHSMNPVGAENMRRIIKRNGWTEVI